MPRPQKKEKIKKKKGNVTAKKRGEKRHAQGQKIKRKRRGNVAQKQKQKTKKTNKQTNKQTKKNKQTKTKQKTKRERYCSGEKKRKNKGNLKRPMCTCTWGFLSIKKKFIPTQFSLNFGKKTF